MEAKRRCADNLCESQRKKEKSVSKWTTNPAQGNLVNKSSTSKTRGMQYVLNDDDKATSILFCSPSQPDCIVCVFHALTPCSATALSRTRAPAQPVTWMIEALLLRTGTGESILSHPVITWGCDKANCCRCRPICWSCHPLVWPVLLRPSCPLFGAVGSGKPPAATLHERR